MKLAIDMPYENVIVPALAALGAIVVLLVVRRIIFRLLQRLSAKSSAEVYDIVLSSIKAPSILWCVAIGLEIGVSLSHIPEKYLALSGKAIQIIVAISVTAALANLAGKIFKRYVRQNDLSVPSTGLAYGVIKGIIYIVGFSIVLGVLGVSIAPLLTALGVGGLAVALALKDTLANLFAGIHIMVEKSIRIGDFVRLESGQEGYIMDITWRTTRIKMLPNNMVIIPNEKLSQSIVTNYYLPERRMSVLIPVSVSYSSDPDHVEKILVEEAKKAVGEIPGLIGEPEPIARLIPGFGGSSLDFTLICQVAEFTDQYPVQHELRKRILKRLRAERVEIPFSSHTVYIRSEEEKP